jgi:uncharacterized membrane protein YgdD (TMEM256/DUF423 family)
LERLLYTAAATAGFLGVAFGAFGAHALRARLSPEMLAVFETGVRYQMYHAFAVFAAAWACARWPRRVFGTAGVMFLAGIVVFCGSLYALALSGERWLGAVTPFGGLAFLTGWLMLAVGAWRARGAD